MASEMYQLEEGELLQPMNVPKAINQLCTSPRGGLAIARAAAHTASRCLELLVHAFKSGSARDLALVLNVILETNHKSLLKAIVKAHGLHIFFYMLSKHQHAFEMTPIVRMTLRVLQHLEKHGVLQGGDLTCQAPHFCMQEFSQLLFSLTKHWDAKVRDLACSFQKLRFHMPRSHPTHDDCKQAQRQLWRDQFMRGNTGI